MTQPHPFAPFIAILGRGKTKTRSLSVQEAEDAMGMILDGNVLPEQLGAFLMLLRVKEESPGEIAGFVRAARARLHLPANAPAVDLDWSSYAGKRRQLPWFLLAAQLLAKNGFRILMHGVEGHTPGRLYTREALLGLGIPVAGSLDEAAIHISQSNFAYVPLECLSPTLQQIMNLRPVLGLRSPVHTIARMLNPLGAPCMLQGIFHPGYLSIHAGAASILGQPRMAVFRGEGGEIERRPNKPCEVWTVQNGDSYTEHWPPLTPDPYQEPDPDMEIRHLAALWRGDFANGYAEAAVAGTLAIALKALGAADTSAAAETMAQAMWRDRDKSGFHTAA